MTATLDRTLYERWLETRDGDAFAEIARRHAPVVYDLAMRASGDASLAEDAVQDALLDLALAGTRKPVEVGLVAWLVRFAICRARNARQSEKSRERRQRIVGERKRGSAMPDDRLELEDELQHVLSHAEPEQRIVLAMRYLHGWEYERIASALAISEGAARVRVHRSLAAIRTRLQRPGVAPTTSDLGVVAGLAAAPLHRMPDGLLELGVDAALRAASSPIPGPGSASGVRGGPRVGRLTLQTLGMTAVVVVGVAAALAVSEPQPLDIATGAPGDPTAMTRVPSRPDAPGTTDAPTADATWPGGPRPQDWDRGELARLRDPGHRHPGPRHPGHRHPGGGSSAGDSAADATDLPTSPARAPDRDAAPRVLRPTSRDVRAATHVPVSSVDERAGISESRTPQRTSGAIAPSPTTEPAPDVRAPGLPIDAVGMDLDAARPRVSSGPPSLVPLDTLPPERLALVTEAAGLVLEVIGSDSAGMQAGIQGLVGDEAVLRRHARKLRKEYRSARARMRRAVAGENAEAFAMEQFSAARASMAQRVLHLLLDVVLADGRNSGDLVWPDGAEAAVALQDVVSLLGTLVPDGAAQGDSVGADRPAALTDAALTDGVLPDGVLPDGAVSGGAQADEVAR